MIHVYLLEHVIDVILLVKAKVKLFYLPQNCLDETSEKFILYKGMREIVVPFTNNIIFKVFIFANGVLLIRS